MGIMSWKWFKAHQWRLLLFALCGLLFASPIAEVFDQQDNIISPVAGLIFFFIAVSSAERVRDIWPLIILTTCWLITSVATEGSGIFAGRSLAAPILFMAILVCIMFLLGRWLIRAVFIDLEVLSAAVCGYLLIGILWAGLYALIQAVDSHALVSSYTTQVDLSDILYFSYITLTTTGYGDILPRNSVVRMLTVMESIVGTFYITIVIARFVSLYGVRRGGPFGIGIERGGSRDE